MAWLAQQESRGPLLTRAVETGAGLQWSVNSGHLWLDGGAPLVDESQAHIDALKRPLEDLLVGARATPEAAAVREKRAELVAAETDVLNELQRISVLHVIRGKCDLC